MELKIDETYPTPVLNISSEGVPSGLFTQNSHIFPGWRLIPGAYASPDPNPFSGENIAFTEFVMKQSQLKRQEIGDENPFSEDTGIYAIPEYLNLQAINYSHFYYPELEQKVGAYLWEKWSRPHNLSLLIVRNLIVTLLANQKNILEVITEFPDQITSPWEFVRGYIAQFGMKMHLVEGHRPTTVIVYPWIPRVPDWDSVFAEPDTLYQQLTDKGVLIIPKTATELISRLREYASNNSRRVQANKRWSTETPTK